MNKIKAAIIEDEIPAARLLRDTLLSLRPDWEVQLLPCLLYTSDAADEL